MLRSFVCPDARPPAWPGPSGHGRFRRPVPGAALMPVRTPVVGVSCTRGCPGTPFGYDDPGYYWGMHAHDDPLRTDEGRWDGAKAKTRTEHDSTGLTALQRTVGNAAVTRLVAQRMEGRRSQTGAGHAEPALHPTRAASRPVHNEFLKEIYRKFGAERRGKTGGGNFAVLLYEDTRTGEQRYEPAFNEPGARHSEVVLIQTLRARHGLEWRPLKLFSDNSPCEACMGQMNTHLLTRQRQDPVVDIYYVVGYNEPTWSRQERHIEIDRWWAEESTEPAS
jgi:hypothetical protein